MTIYESLTEEAERILKFSSEPITRVPEAVNCYSKITKHIDHMRAFAPEIGVTLADDDPRIKRLERLLLELRTHVLRMSGAGDEGLRVINVQSGSDVLRFLFNALHDEFQEGTTLALDRQGQPSRNP